MVPAGAVLGIVATLAVAGFMLGITMGVEKYKRSTEFAKRKVDQILGTTEKEMNRRASREWRNWL